MKRSLFANYSDLVKSISLLFLITKKRAESHFRRRELATCLKVRHRSAFGDAQRVRPAPPSFSIETSRSYRVSPTGPSNRATNNEPRSAIVTYRRVANGCNDASGGACAYMAISRTPVIRTRKRRILLIHPLGMLPTILASL